MRGELLDLLESLRECACGIRSLDPPDPHVEILVGLILDILRKARGTVARLEYSQ